MWMRRQSAHTRPIVSAPPTYAEVATVYRLPSPPAKAVSDDIERRLLDSLTRPTLGLHEQLRLAGLLRKWRLANG